MKIEVGDTKEYDAGIHPEVTEIMIRRRIVGNFFKRDRFPNLVKLVCYHNQLTELELDCPSLQTLYCHGNQLTGLELDCPSLQELQCSCNELTNLKLICPSLQDLCCYVNQLTDLNGLEFCSELKKLCCSPALKDSVDILRHHLPDLRVLFHRKD